MDIITQNRQKVGFYEVCQMCHFNNAKFTIPGVTLTVSTLSLYSPKLASKRLKIVPNKNGIVVKFSIESSKEGTGM